MIKFTLSNKTIKFSDKKLYRIKAEISFGKIQEGDLGGFIEKENNLTQEGNAWVSGNAKVFGNAKVAGNAKISGNAEVSGNAKVAGNAKVYGNAWVYGNAKVYGNARVSGSAWVYGNAWVSGNAWVYGDAKATDNAKISRSAEVYGVAEIFGNAKVSNLRLINIIGLKWNITISDNHIQIGSKLHKIKEWQNFSDEKVAQMSDDELSWWEIYKDIILSIASRKLRRLDFAND